MEPYSSPSELIKQGIKKAIEDTYKRREMQRQKDEEQEIMKDDVVNYILNELQETIRTYPTQKEKWYMDILLNKTYLKDRIYDLELKLKILRRAYYDSPSYSRTRWEQIDRYMNKINIYKELNSIIEFDTLKTTLREHGYSVTPYKVYKTFLWIPYSLVSDHRVAMKDSCLKFDSCIET